MPECPEDPHMTLWRQECRWISVIEKFPLNRSYVFVMVRGFNGPRNRTAYWRDGYFLKDDPEEAQRIIDGVTHWMSLPPRPIA